MTPNFEYQIIGNQAWDIDNDNIDVQVHLPDGSSHTATFFTLSNIAALFKKFKETGECNRGQFFWASDMILVEKLERSVIHDAIESLLIEGSFNKAFTRIR